MRIGVGTGAAALLVAPLALVVLHGGGSRAESLVPVATVALLAAGGLVAAAAWGAVRWPAVGRPGALLVGALVAYVVWGGITTVWSIAPDRSWSWLNRGLVYLAFLVLGMVLAGALPRARSAFTLALAAVVGVALLWALVGAVFPDLGPDVELSARLREPVGYWNALAVVFALGMPPALWLAVDRARAPWLR